MTEYQNGKSFSAQIKVEKWQNKMLKEVDFRHYSNKLRTIANKTQARIIYLRVLKDHPTKKGINHDLARYLRDDKLYKEAEFRYRKTSILMPKETFIYHEWGLLLERQGKLEGQEELYRKMIEIKPNSLDGLCNLGAVLARKCKFEEAIVVFEKALVYKPNDTMVLSNLATVCLTLGRYDETIEKLQKALEIDANHLNANINLGLANSCLGKDEEANENYKRALELLGDNSDKKEEVLWSLNLTKESLLEEENDEEKRKYNDRLRKALEEFKTLLLES